MSIKLTKVPCPWWHVFFHTSISSQLMEFKCISCSKCKINYIIYPERYNYKVIG